VSPNPLSLTAGSSGKFSVTVATIARTTTQLGVTQTLSAASHFHRAGLLLGSLVVMVGAMLIPVRLSGKGWRRLLVLGGIVLWGVCLGCGGGSGGGNSGGTTATGTASGTYSIVVTGTSGSATQSTTLKLTVQ
jgi:hypothetical protein